MLTFLNIGVDTRLLPFWKGEAREHHDAKHTESLYPPRHRVTRMELGTEFRPASMFWKRLNISGTVTGPEPQAFVHKRRAGEPFVTMRLAWRQRPFSEV